MIADAFKNMSVASYILLGLFIAACIVQLTFAFLEKEKYRRIEKPFCLALLTAFAAVTLPNHPMIYIATLCGMIGDILVILPNKKCFYVGAFCFFSGFVLYALEGLLILMGGNISVYAVVVIITTYIVMTIAIIFLLGKRITPSKGEMIGLGLYLGPLFTLVVVMVYLTVKGGGVMWLSLIGSIFFLSSDLLITFTKYVKKFKRYDFYVMGTYLIAQLLIVLGYILTYLAK